MNEFYKLIIKLMKFLITALGKDIMLDSRDGGDGGLPSDLIEVKGEKERENINISDLEMTPATPDIKNRSIKKN